MPKHANPADTSRQDGLYRNYVPFGPNLHDWQAAMSSYVGERTVGRGTSVMPSGAELYAWIYNPAFYHDRKLAKADTLAAWNNNSSCRNRSTFMAAPLGQYRNTTLIQQQMLPQQVGTRSGPKFNAFIQALNAAFGRLQ